jgi:outer membrane protein assembly factor BamB
VDATVSRRLLIVNLLVLAAGGAVYGLAAGGVLFRPESPPAVRMGDDEADVAPQVVAAAVATTTAAIPPARIAVDAQTGSWPTPFGPDHNGASPETGLDWTWCDSAPRILWEAPVGTGYNIPAIAHERVVVWTRTGDVERLDCRGQYTGELLWTREYPATYRCPYEYSSGPHASPVIDGDRVFVLGAAGSLRAIALSSGELLWERDLKADLELDDTPYSLGASPLVQGDRVILALPAAKSRGAGVVAISTQTGETLWTATDHGLSYATAKPVQLGERAAAVVFTGKGVLTLDAKDGAILGEFKFGVGEGRSERVNAVSPLVVGQTVFVTAGPGPGIAALSLGPAGELSLLWRNRRLLDSQYTTVVHHQGFLYGFNSLWNGTCDLRCIDAQTAEQRWGHESDLRRGQTLLVDGRLVVLGEHGHLAVLDASPESARVRYFSPEPLLSKPCYCAPALAGGLLFVRDERRMLAIDGRPVRTGAP